MRVMVTVEAALAVTRRLQQWKHRQSHQRQEQEAVQEKTVAGRAVAPLQLTVLISPRVTRLQLRPQRHQPRQRQLPAVQVLELELVQALVPEQVLEQVQVQAQAQVQVQVQLRGRVLMLVLVQLVAPTQSCLEGVSATCHRVDVGLLQSSQLPQMS